MRPFRLVVAVSAAALLGAGCGAETTSGNGVPAASSPAPSPTPSSNGVATLEPTEILSKSKAALKKVQSLRVKGGGKSEGAAFQLDMRYGNGGKAIGTISNNGKTIELRRIGQLVYLKGDRDFWTSIGGPSAANLFVGKYLKAPVSDKRVVDLASFTDKSRFVDQLLDPSGSKITKGGKKTIRGVQAVELLDKSADGGSLYIATTGQPYPLQLVPSSSGGDSGRLDFLDFGKSVTVPTPPADQTVDVTKLGN